MTQKQHTTQIINLHLTIAHAANQWQQHQKEIDTIRHIITCNQQTNLPTKPWQQLLNKQTRRQQQLVQTLTDQQLKYFTKAISHENLYSHHNASNN